MAKLPFQKLSVCLKPPNYSIKIWESITPIRIIYKVSHLPTISFNCYRNILQTNWLKYMPD